MQLNLKFFIVSVVLSVIAGLPSLIYQWWFYVSYRSAFGLFYVYNFIESIAVIGVGVLLPFAVMFLLGREISKSALLGISISIFLGCWIGSAISYSLTWLVLPVLNGAQFGISLDVLFLIVRLLVATAFPMIFFVSWSAILFSFYKNAADKPTENPQKIENRLE